MLVGDENFELMSRNLRMMHNIKETLVNLFILIIIIY